MTPGARVAAAIEVLDQVLAGDAAEKALTRWARASRFAGSKDRAAVRDLVFDAVRKRDSFHALSGQPPEAMTGRSLMIGGLRAGGEDPEAIFSGARFCPPELTEAERGATPNADWHANMPDWVFAQMQADLGEGPARAQASLLAERAPITLRVNLAKTTRDAVQRRLEHQGYAARENPLSPTALTIDGAARGLTGTDLFLDGLIAMQDASSQAVVDAIDVKPGARILDFCAGGGGKTLALAARFGGQITAHDADPNRMKDLPARAKKAGADVALQHSLSAVLPGAYDLVLVDAPCSGSGSWRRAPDAKWRLTPDRLAALRAEQREILTQTQSLVAQGGVLAFATCSILQAENAEQAAWFTEIFSAFSLISENHWPISADGDGFYLAQFKHG